MCILGYILALGFDLVSIVCMMARLSALRLRDERGSRLNLVGVIICAIVSAFANSAGSLQGYNPVNLDHTPIWMQEIAPWAGMIFPLLIVVLSMTTDHILDHTSAKGVDVATFRAQEKRRVELLQARLDTEKELLALEAQLATVRGQRAQASGHIVREWFFWRWLRPVAPVQVPDEHIIERAVQGTRAMMDEQFAHTMKTLEVQVQTWMAEVNAHLRTQRTKKEHFQEQVASEANSERIDIRSQNHEPNAEEQGGLADRILNAFERLGTTATDTQVAREVNCSRPTVTRWRKKFQEQGIFNKRPTA